MGIEKLSEKIRQASANVSGVSIGRKIDKSTWRVDFTDQATQAERDAVALIISQFNIDEPSQSDYEAAIERHLSLVAAERGYKSEVSILSYRDSSIAAWSAEANAYALWRDSVWAAAYAVLSDVQSGRTKAPSPTELLRTLPAMSWPST
jgi:hypothetical protein